MAKKKSSAGKEDDLPLDFGDSVDEIMKNSDQAGFVPDVDIYKEVFDDYKPPVFFGPPDLRTRELFTKELHENGNTDIRRQQKAYSEICGKDLLFRGFSDVRHARKVLVDEFPYAVDVIDRLLSPTVRWRSGGKTGAIIEPLVIYGPPGLGKSRLARRVCDALGLPSRTISVAGMHDDLIFGVTRGWSSAQASTMTDLIREYECINPVLILDEIEKASTDNRNGSILMKLLALLEKTEAKAWNEPLLQTSVNMSRVGWIFTANTLEGIPGPLRSRLQAIKMSTPSVDHVAAIVRTMRREVAAGDGVDERWLPSLDLAEMLALKESYAEHLSVRILKQQVLAILAGRKMTMQ